jgi:hypothetical protein
MRRAFLHAKNGVVMARPRNEAGTKSLSVVVSPLVRAWLEQLASFGVYGRTATAVAEHFVNDAVAQELKGGLLRNPPPMPPQKPHGESST